MKPFVLKRILVTGASGGIGQAVCARLAEKGHFVLGISRHFQIGTPLLALPALPTGPRKDGKAYFALCDVTDSASVSHIAAMLRSMSGHLDAIVHTAGIYDLDSLVEMDEERFLRMFDVNLFGVYRINRAMMPFLTAGSRIVLISSELAPLDPLPFTGIYAISKAALEKYAYSLRMELQLLGMNVSVIRPGAVQTGLLKKADAALNRFGAHTTHYVHTAEHFHDVIDHVEARSVPVARIADMVERAVTEKRPRYVYNINRNRLLRLLSALPAHVQAGIIRRMLRAD